MPPPAFEYSYWKCYYAANSKAFKAAELYSTDVDYFTFGSCRLVHGAYYCGRFSATAPYKGLVDARQPTAAGCAYQERERCQECAAAPHGIG